MGLGGALQGQTPLARAAQHASLDLVEVLLAAGALPHGTGPQVSSNSHSFTLMQNLSISLFCESAVTQPS